MSILQEVAGEYGIDYEALFSLLGMILRAGHQQQVTVEEIAEWIKAFQS